MDFGVNVCLLLTTLLIPLSVLTLKVSNLEWCTQQEKIYRLGEFPKPLTLSLSPAKLLVSMKLKVSSAVCYIIQSLQQASELEQTSLWFYSPLKKNTS